MNKFYSALILTFVSFGITAIADEIKVTNGSIESITESLQGLSTDELIERRNILLAQADILSEDEYDDGCENNVDDDNDGNIDGDDSDCSSVGAVVTSRASAILELSIIEQLLLVSGAVLLDNVNEDSSTPPDTVSPVLTVLGSNPATVELGDVYVDAGATSDGGEIVTSSGTVDNVNCSSCCC